MSRSEKTVLAVIAMATLLIVTISDRPRSNTDVAARYQTRQRTSQFFGRSTISHARRS